MSETRKAMDEAKDALNIEPVLNLVDKLAESQVKSESEFTERINEIETKAERLVGDLGGKMNKSVEDLIERIELLKKSSSAFNKTSLGLRVEEGDAIMRNAMPDNLKGNMGVHELVHRSLGEKTLLSSPEIAAWNHEYFVSSTHYQAGQRKGDPALLARRDKARRVLDENAGVTKADLAEETANVGAELIPTVTQGEILRLVLDAGDVFPAARQMMLSTLTTKIPSESTAVSVGWALEAGALTGTEGNFSEVTLKADKLYARAQMSIELVQDSAPGLLPYLLSVFSEKMARELDAQLVFGDGTTPAITGITNASGIAAITSGTAAGRDLSYNLLVQAYTGAAESGPRDNGVWIMSKRGLTQVLALVATDGQPIVRLGNVEGAPAMTLFGRPMIVSGALGGSATLDDTTNANTTICFGPLSALIAGTRMGMTWDVTDQVGWANFQMDARLVGRFAGAVGVPAAWTALTHVNY